MDIQQTLLDYKKNNCRLNKIIVKSNWWKV